MNKPFTSIPWPIKIVHVQSPIISQQELTKRSNNGLRDMTCVSIYIYILSFFRGSNFRKQSGQPICLRLSLQLRLWLLRLLVEVLLPFIRLTCVLCLTPLRLKIKKTSRPMKVHHIFDYFLGESYFIYFTNSWRLNFQKQKRIPKHVMPTHVMNKKYRTWLPPEATAEPTQDASTRILIFLGDQKPQPQPTPFPTGRRVATTNLAGRWPIVPGFRTRKMLQAGHRVGRPGGRDVTNHWLWWGNEPSEGMMCALYGRGSYDSFMNQLHTPRSLFAETKEGGFKCRFWRFRKIQIQTPPKKSLQKPMVTGQKWKPQRVQKHCYARKTRLGQPICQMRFVYCHLTSSPKWGWR